MPRYTRHVEIGILRIGRWSYELEMDCQARVQAVQQARERANLYARAAGLRVVRILSISEGGGYFGPPPVVFARGSIAGAPPPPPPPSAPIQPGELQMTASVTVLFELAAS